MQPWTTRKSNNSPEHNSHVSRATTIHLNITVMCLVQQQFTLSVFHSHPELLSLLWTTINGLHVQRSAGGWFASPWIYTCYDATATEQTLTSSTSSHDMTHSSCSCQLSVTHHYRAAVLLMSVQLSDFSRAKLPYPNTENATFSLKTLESMQTAGQL